MSVPRFKANHNRPERNTWDVVDLAANGLVIIADVPSSCVIDVVEQLNQAYGVGVQDGTISERLSHAGGLRPRQVHELRDWARKEHDRAARSYRQVAGNPEIPSCHPERAQMIESAQRMSVLATLMDKL